ncbi:MAG TPA: acetate uptake transporter [Balneolales bacterium]|nr:acetate uptake transporter [Balneolales bacterium]
MNNKLANPKVLGYAAIFITGWMFSMYNAGWFMKQLPESDLVTGLILGGVVVAVVGILSFIRGETFEMTLFLGLGTFFFVISLANMQSSSLMSEAPMTANAAWLNIVWAAFFFYLWLGVMKKDLFINLFMIGLWLTFLALAIGGWIMAMFLIYIAGYLGLITALLAGWLSAREILMSEESGQSTETAEA